MVEFYFNIIAKIAIVFYGLWIGGLATTIYNRIPNDIPIGPSQKPKCNNCGNEITLKYFFPILGFCLCRGRCINCGMKIPRVYPLMETSILSYILLLSLSFDYIDERFIFKSLYGALLITLCFVFYSFRHIKERLVWMLISFVFAYRGYNHCLPDVLMLFFCGVMAYISYFLLKKCIKIDKNEAEIYVFLIASLGIITSLCFLLLSFIYYLLCFKIKLFSSMKINGYYRETLNFLEKNFLYSPLITAIIISLFNE